MVTSPPYKVNQLNMRPRTNLMLFLFHTNADSCWRHNVLQTIVIVKDKILPRIESEDHGILWNKLKDSVWITRAMCLAD